MTKGLKRTPVARCNDHKVGKAQAFQTVSIIIMTGCRTSEAKSKGQLGKGVRTTSIGKSVRTVSINESATSPARPIPHWKSQPTKPSNHTTKRLQKSSQRAGAVVVEREKAGAPQPAPISMPSQVSSVEVLDAA